MAKKTDTTVAEAERAADELPRFTVERSVEPMLPPPRRVLITRDILSKVGCSEGCDKCTAIRIGDDSKVGLAHSRACRLRVESRMSEDPFLQKKLDEAVRRQDEYLERRVEAGDLSAKRRRDEGAAEAAEAPVVPDPAPPAPAEGGGVLEPRVLSRA